MTKLTPEELADIREHIDNHGITARQLYWHCRNLLDHIKALQAELTAKDEDGKRIQEILEISNSRFERFMEALSWLKENHKNLPEGHTVEGWINNQQDQAVYGLRQTGEALKLLQDWRA